MKVTLKMTLDGDQTLIRGKHIMVCPWVHPENRFKPCGLWCPHLSVGDVEEWTSAGKAGPICGTKYRAARLTCGGVERVYELDKGEPIVAKEGK